MLQNRFVRLFFLSLLIELFAFSSLTAQLFELAEGPIVNTPSDSRSVNFLDLNNDGWEDIYISNGLSGGQQDLLYLNDGTGQFTAITDMEIVLASNPSDGASFADYNNDGHVDGIVSSWYGAEDLLYLNDGNGSLNYNAAAGMASGSFAETATFGDYDNDGWLDLYITHSDGNKKNFLYKNLQNGKFEQITDHLLVEDTKLSRAAIWGDFNNDGFLDLFVTNENNGTNDLFFGQEGGAFEKLGAGTIVNSQKSTMTGSWGDIDNDLDPDLFVGNSAYFSGQNNQLFRNQTFGFEEITDGPVVSPNQCTFGSAFGDYDNDGDLDLAIANGFCNTGMANVLYENQGDGTFADSSHLLPSNSNICSFGLAWGDVNNDGFLDLMIANCKNSPGDSQKNNSLYINQGNTNNWIKIKLVGVLSNRNAIGAKVKVKAIINGQEVWQVREISAQTGYAGQNSLIAHFGLGDANQVDSLVIEWPAGGTQALGPTDSNQLLTLEEEITSSLESPDLQQKISLKVFPNPLHPNAGSFSLIIRSKAYFGEANILLFDSLGQQLWNKEIDIRQEISNIDLALGKAPSPGIYQLILQIGENRLVKKVAVQ